MAKQLPPTAIVVYAYLLRCERNKRSYPGLDNIAAMCGCGRSSVLRSISELERLKLIAIERASGKANTYLITDKSAWRTSVKMKRVSKTNGCQNEPGPVPNPDGTSLILTRDQSHFDTRTRLSNKTKEQNNEQETESDDSAAVELKKTSSIPFQMIEALYDYTGGDIDDFSRATRMKGKHLAIAKRLAEDGFAPEDVPAIMFYTDAQGWRKAGWDILEVERNAAKWVAANKPRIAPGGVAAFNPEEYLRKQRGGSRGN